MLSGRRGVFAVNGDNGYPYAIPINYIYDADDGKIYFHGAKAGHKIDAIRTCDKVCFTVYRNETVKEEAWAPFLPLKTIEKLVLHCFFITFQHFSDVRVFILKIYM